MVVAADLASWAAVCSSGDHSPFKSRASALLHVALKPCSGRVSTYHLSIRAGGGLLNGLCLESQEVGSSEAVSWVCQEPF